MNKTQKKLLVALCIITVISVIVFGGFRILEYIEGKNEREIMSAYTRLHYAVGWGLGNETEPFLSEYLPFFDPEIPVVENGFGIRVDTYLMLKMYEIRTGGALSFYTLVDYFSQEFEPDGSLRLYNNGKHPAIQAFVEWVWEGQRQREQEAYIHDIFSIYLQYSRTNEGFIEHRFSELSPQMLDALVRAEADPDYVLDLTGLQQAGY